MMVCTREAGWDIRIIWENCHLPPSFIASQLLLCLLVHRSKSLASQNNPPFWPTRAKPQAPLQPPADSFRPALQASAHLRSLAQQQQLGSLVERGRTCGTESFWQGERGRGRKVEQGEVEGVNVAAAMQCQIGMRAHKSSLHSLPSTRRVVRPGFWVPKL